MNGRGRGAAGRGASPAAAAGKGAATVEEEPDDNEVVVAGLVGSGGGGLTALVFAAREGDLESAQAAARCRRGHQSDHRIRLDAAADRHQQPPLRARGNSCSTAAPTRTSPTRAAGRRSTSPPTTATSKAATTRCRSRTWTTSSIIKLAARPRRRSERARQGQHADAHDLHDAVVLRGRRDAVRARGAVERHRADEAAARATAPIRSSRPRLRRHRAHAAGGIGWVEGVTYERSPKENVEAVKMLLDLGLDPNARQQRRPHAADGRGAQGPQRRRSAARRPRREARPARQRQPRHRHDRSRRLAGHTWQALDYADGLVRVGVQSAVNRPETAALIRKLMTERGLPVPPANRNILSICVVALCQ